MFQLGTCTACKGFLGIAVQACPHCGVALGRARRVVAGATALLGGSSVSMTLMACYGPACVDEHCHADVEDAGHSLADARVNVLDATDDAAGDGAIEASSDAARDATGDARLDGGAGDGSDGGDASVDAPTGG